jgi:hypothetical protein
MRTTPYGEPSDKETDKATQHTRRKACIECGEWFDSEDEEEVCYACQELTDHE